MSSTSTTPKEKSIRYALRAPLRITLFCPSSSCRMSLRSKVDDPDILCQSTLLFELQLLHGADYHKGALRSLAFAKVRTHAAPTESPLNTSLNMLQTPMAFPHFQDGSRIFTVSSDASMGVVDLASQKLASLHLEVAGERLFWCPSDEQHTN